MTTFQTFSRTLSPHPGAQSPYCVAIGCGFLLRSGVGRFRMKGDKRRGTTRAPELSVFAVFIATRWFVRSL